MALSAVKHAVSSVSRTSRIAAVSTAMLVSAALILTGFGAASASADPSPSTTLELRLTSATGAAVTDTQLVFFPYADGDLDYESLSNGSFAVSSPVKGKPGTYAVDLTGAGGPGEYTAYLFGTHALGTAGQYLGGASTIEDAKSVTVHAGKNSANISFAASGKISGTVKSPKGKGVAGVCVEAFKWNGNDWNPQGANILTGSGCSAATASTGRYSFNPGAAGSYKLEFFAESGTYLPQFANGALDIDSASSVFLGSGDSSVVDTTLALAGRFTGSLLGPNGKPIVDASVGAYRLTGTPGHFTAASAGSSYADTDKKGKFTLGGLSTGYYSIGYSIFNEDDFSEVDGFIGGSSALTGTAFAAVTAQTVPLTPFHTGSTTATLGSLDVTLTYGGGNPLHDADDVELLSVDGSTEIGSDDHDGDVWHFEDVSPGDYELLVDDSNFIPVLEPVTITAGLTTKAVDLQPITPLVFTTDPALDSETPVVGASLTADPGSVNRTSPDSSTTYQWFRNTADGALPIFGARSASYTPKGTDVGDTLSVRVTRVYAIGSDDFLVFKQSVSKTLTTDVVPAAGEIHNISLPEIVYDGAVGPGVTLQTSGGVWDVPGVHLSYQWHSNRDATDHIVPGATKSSYTLTAEDFGNDVYAMVTATKPGYTASFPQESNPVPVGVGAAPTVVKAPKITSAKTASSRTFTITPGTWSLPSSSLAVTYTWTADDASGTPITASGTTFATDTKGAVTVVAVAHSDVFADGTWTGLAQRGAVAAPLTGMFDSTSPGDYSYTIGALGQPIAYQQHSGAEKSSGTFQRLVGKTWKPFTSQGGWLYSTTLKDLGTKIRYVTTYTSPLYVTVTSTTAPFTVAPRTGLDDNSSAQITGATTIGGTLKAQTTGFAVPGVKHTYQWQSSTNGGTTWKSIPKATSPTVLLKTPLAAGNQLRVVVGTTAPGFASTKTTSASVTLATGQTTIGNIAKPTVTPGDLRAGRTATASVGTWDVAGVGVSYDWQLDGVSTGATGKTFVTPADAAGKSLTVVATAHKTGYSDSGATTSSPVVLAAATPKSATPVANFPLGVVKFGSEVSAGDPKVIFGLDADASGFITSYQWKLSGKSIAGATATTYTPTAAQIGKTLSVAVTLRSDVYGSATANSKASVVLVADALELGVLVDQSTSPAASGTLLTAHADNVHSLALKYIWESSTGGGAWSPIASATGASYTVGSTFAGADIRVVVSGTKTGYATSSATSGSISISSRGTFAAITDPTVGSAQVDAITTVDPGVWNIAGATFAYQWLLDGVPIPGATSATIKPSPKFVGSDLSVRVTASKPGYVSGVATSDDQQIVLGVKATATVQPKVTGCGTLSVSPGSWSNAGITETYQWTVDGIPDADATATSFTKPDTGVVAVVVTIASSGHATANYTYAAPSGAACL